MTVSYVITVVTSPEMNLVRALAVVLVPLLLYAQPAYPHLLDLDQHPVQQGSRAFNVIEVVDSTTYTEWGYGKVYTGLVNTRRPLHFENGLTLVLKQALLRGVEDRDLPTARLVVHDLRIDEEITPTSEHRRLQLLASLELLQDSSTTRIGPLLETEVHGGIDVTRGHAAALSEAIGRLLDRFDLVVEPATAGLPGPTYVHETSRSHRPDGAYHGYADYRIGRVDTSVHLSARATRVQAGLGKLSFRAAYLEPGPDAQPRDLKEVWGYHVDGHSYLQMNKKFYEITQDEEGRTLVYIEEGLFDPEAMRVQLVGGALGGVVGMMVFAVASGSGEETPRLYEIDLRHGSLTPYEMTYPPIRVGRRTMLTSAEPPGGRHIEVHRPGETQSLGPGEYLLLEPGEQVSFATVGFRWEPVAKRLREGSLERPVLYRISVVDSGGVRIRKTSSLAAQHFRESLEAGAVEPAR